MIDAIKTVVNVTDELSQKLSEIEKTQNSTKKATNCINFEQNLLNYEILDTKKILLATFDVKQNVNLYLQCQLEFSLQTTEKIRFTILINDIAIYKSTKNLNAGFNQINLNKNYTPLISESIDVYIVIEPLTNKMVLLSFANLAVWGISEIENDITYNSLDIKDNLLISYLDNNLLYYKIVPNTVDAFTSEDFIFLSNAKAYCFAFDSDNNKTLFFRIDSNGTLFYSDLNSGFETSIDTNTYSVSACYGQNKLFVCYLKDNLCHYLEIKDNTISSVNYFKCYNYKLKSVYTYFNKYSKKFYIVLEDFNNSNFLLESSVEDYLTNENISIKYSINIDTYEVLDEN